jgi:hypothetical protein
MLSKIKEWFGFKKSKPLSSNDVVVKSNYDNYLPQCSNMKYQDFSKKVHYNSTPPKSRAIHHGDGSVSFVPVVLTDFGVSNMLAKSAAASSTPVEIDTSYSSAGSSYSGGSDTGSTSYSNSDSSSSSSSE